MTNDDEDEIPRRITSVHLAIEGAAADTLRAHRTTLPAEELAPCGAPNVEAGKPGTWDPWCGDPMCRKCEETPSRCTVESIVEDAMLEKPPIVADVARKVACEKCDGEGGLPGDPCVVCGGSGEVPAPPCKCGAPTPEADSVEHAPGCSRGRVRARIEAEAAKIRVKAHHELMSRACDVLSSSLMRCLDVLIMTAAATKGLDVEGMRAWTKKGKKHPHFDRVQLAHDPDLGTFAVAIDGEIVTPAHGFSIDFDGAGEVRGGFGPMLLDDDTADGIDDTEPPPGVRETFGRCSRCGAVIALDDDGWRHVDGPTVDGHDPEPMPEA